MLGKPFLSGEDGVGLVVGEEIADHLRAFCHEETFTTAELLLFQLTDEFDMILTDCHRFLVQRYKNSVIICVICGFFCTFADDYRLADENSDDETVFGDGRRSVDPVRLFSYPTSARRFLYVE